MLAEIGGSHGSEDFFVDLLNWTPFRFVGDTNILEKHTIFIFCAEDGGSMFLQNAGIYLQTHMSLQSRRQTLTF